MLTLLLTLLLPSAHAEGPPAWYHPDEVAGHSDLFAASAEALAPQYEALDTGLRRLSPAIEDLELGATLAEDRLSKDTSAYAEATRAQATAMFLSAQRHVDLVTDTYAGSFGAALERALVDVGAGLTVVECGGSRLPGISSTRSCKGEDLNAKLAAALDADAGLAAAIGQVDAMAWPEVALSGATQPVVKLTGSAGYVHLAPLARALWPQRLETRSDDLDRDVASLDQAIAAGDPDAIAAGRKHRAAYERRMATDGGLFLALIEESLARVKKGAGADVGVCVNPESLGGCDGVDRTAELLPRLQADKKLVKALEGAP